MFYKDIKQLVEYIESRDAEDNDEEGVYFFNVRIYFNINFFYLYFYNLVK